MGPDIPLVTSFWPIFDGLCRNDDQETDEDAVEFEAQLMAEPPMNTNHYPSPVLADRTCSSPISYELDGPTVSTPGDITQLRPPQLSVRAKPNTLSTFTPEIASPADSPQRSSSTSEGRAKRDDPDTPVPLGGKIRQRSDFQTMSKHLVAFEKSLSKMDIQRKTSHEKGRVEKNTRQKVLEGCRICIPIGQGSNAAPSRQQGKWKIVSHHRYKADSSGRTTRRKGCHSARYCRDPCHIRLQLPIGFTGTAWTERLERITSGNRVR